MSRIGKMPVLVPHGVKIELNENTVKVTGPRGVLSRGVHPEMQVELTPTQVWVKRPSDSTLHRSLHGLTRTLVANMVQGVTEGYTRELEVIGVGYKAAKQGDALLIHIGYSHPVTVEPPPGIEFDVRQERGQPVTLIVRGTDKELVGQVCANLREIRSPEPYKGKGIKYKEEVIQRKMGKAGKTGK